MSITLHKELGVNPHMTVCRRCGDGKELVLLGNKTIIVKCYSCGITCYGGKPKLGRCPSCNEQSNYWETIGEIKEYDKLPSSELCEACETEIALHEKIVSEGGIYWKCADCSANGVIKSSEFANDVRSTHGLTNGEPCGVEFTKEDCPNCNQTGE